MCSVPLVLGEGCKLYTDQIHHYRVKWKWWRSEHCLRFLLLDFLTARRRDPGVVAASNAPSRSEEFPSFAQRQDLEALEAGIYIIYNDDNYYYHSDIYSKLIKIILVYVCVWFLQCVSHILLIWATILPVQKLLEIHRTLVFSICQPSWCYSRWMFDLPEAVICQTLCHQCFPGWRLKKLHPPKLD